MMTDYNYTNFKIKLMLSVFYLARLRLTDCSPTNISDETEIDEDYLSKFLGIHLAQGSVLKFHVDRDFSKFCKTVMDGVVQTRVEKSHTFDTVLSLYLGNVSLF